MDRPQSGPAQEPEDPQHQGAQLHRRGADPPAKGVRLQVRRGQGPHPPHGPAGRRAFRRNGHRHPAGRAERPAPAAVQLLQAAVRTGDQPAHRRHPRESRHLHQRLRGCPWQPAGRQARKLQGAQGPQPHSDLHRPAQDQIHERAGLQGRDRFHQLLQEYQPGKGHRPRLPGSGPCI